MGLMFSANVLRWICQCLALDLSMSCAGLANVLRKICRCLAQDKKRGAVGVFPPFAVAGVAAFSEVAERPCVTWEVVVRLGIYLCIKVCEL